MWYKEVLFSTYFATAAFIVGVILLPRLSFISKTILLIVFANIITDLYSTYLSIQLNKSTHFLYNIFTGVEYTAMLLINLYKPHSSLYRKFLSGSIFFLITLYLFNFYKYGIEDLNTYLYAIGSFIVCIFSYLRIRFTITSDNVEFSNILIWFALANITFSVGALPILLITPIKGIPNSIANDLFVIKDIAYSIWAVLITIGFLCQKKKTI